VWGVRTRLVYCSHIPRSYSSRCLSRPPRSSSRLHLHRHNYFHRQRRCYSIITDAFFLFYHCGSTTRRLQARHAEDRDCRSSLLATQRRVVAARLRSFRLIAVREKVKVTPFLLCNISLRLYLIHVALVFR
jgi:hypothetical protein